MALFDIKNLSFAYPAGKRILRDVTLTVEQGDFLVLCGPTGSGKTTLLKLLKPELFPLGEKSGEVLFEGADINALPPEASCRIGFVQQSPEHQIVTDKVWHEIAFGMENMCFDKMLMKRRMAEIMSYFSIDSQFDTNTSDLSGGQKQMISLASVLVMDPKVIILDEPTSQLDPVSASGFLQTLKKLNDELGLTIIITEHRLENVIPLGSKLCVIEDGSVTALGETKQAIKEILSNEKIRRSMPGSVQIFHTLGANGECPLNVPQGRAYLKNNMPQSIRELPEEEQQGGSETEIKIKNLCLRYSKNSPDVLNQLNLTVYKNEILCVLGANGSGKTTLLNAVANLVTPYAGKIEIKGKNIKKYRGQELYNNLLAMLPQDVETVFLRNTLQEEFEKAGVDPTDLPYDLSYAYSTHPYDLSGGEQQLAALAVVLASKPEILLLDEPTKGLDNGAKATLCKALRALKEKGKTIVIVTLDVEFAARCADRAAMMFRGEITCIETPRRFFTDNIFYTTSVAKITAGLIEGAVTPEDFEYCAGGGK